MSFGLVNRHRALDDILREVVHGGPTTGQISPRF